MLVIGWAGSSQRPSSNLSTFEICAAVDARVGRNHSASASPHLSAAAFNKRFRILSPQGSFSMMHQQHKSQDLLNVDFLKIEKGE